MTGDHRHEVMTLAEVATYLKLAERTVLRMAQRGEIPATKVASQWRFMLPLVQDWLLGQMQGTMRADRNATIGPPPTLIRLDEVVQPRFIVPHVGPGPKEQVLRQLVAPLMSSGFARDPTRLLDALLQRERLMTTAVGHGIAIPHTRHHLDDMFPEPAVVLGVCRDGTDYGAIDDRLVQVFFLTCATREDIHLQLQASISWFARHHQAIEELIAAPDPSAIRDVVCRYYRH